MPRVASGLPGSLPLPAHIAHQQGSAEPTWLLDERWARARSRRLETLAGLHSQVVVVTGHRHDVLLALGASMADLAAAGLPVRRVGVPRLVGALDEGSLVLAPWSQEPEHRRAGRAAERAARAAGAAIMFYPLACWRQLDPDDLPWESLLVLSPTADGLVRKAAMLSALPGDDPGVTANPARRVIEVLIDTPSAHWNRRAGLAGRTDGRDQADERRCDLLDNLASRGDWSEQAWPDLPALVGGRRFSHGLEVGMVGGRYVGQLAEFCDTVTSFDATGREPLSVAGRQNDTPVTWAVGRLPRDLPTARADLIVLSEAGSWLGGAALLGCLSRLRHLLYDDGVLVLAHRRGAEVDSVLTGDLVHHQALAALDLDHVGSAGDDDVRIDVWRLRSSRGL